MSRCIKSKKPDRMSKLALYYFVFVRGSDALTRRTAFQQGARGKQSVVKLTASHDTYNINTGFSQVCTFQQFLPSGTSLDTICFLKSFTFIVLCTFITHQEL